MIEIEGHDEASIVMMYHLIGHFVELSIEASKAPCMIDLVSICSSSLTQIDPTQFRTAQYEEGTC